MNFDRKYLVLALGFVLIWMCLGIFVTTLQNLADGVRQWVHSFRQKKGLG